MSAAYLLRGVSPQEDALGQCALAADGSPALLWRDPAAMGFHQGAGLALSHAVGPLGGDTEYLAASFTWGRQSLGLQGYYQGDSDTFRDDQGQIGATFTNQETLAGLAYAVQLGATHAGIGVKLLGETLAGQQAADGALVDVGALWRFWADRWQLSLAAQNLGTAPHWDGGVQYSPSTLGLGLRECLGAEGGLRLLQDFRLVEPMDLGGGGLEPDVSPLLAGLGLEWALPTPALPVCLRLGYAWGDDEADAPFGLSGGVGVDWGGVHLDYAFTWLGGLGGSNRLGISWGQR